MEKKCIILITIFLSLLLFTSTSYSVEITESELKIYYETKDDSKSDEEICEKYGITSDTLEDIKYKGTHAPLTIKEEAINRDYEKRTDALPESATDEDWHRIRREVCSDYGITDSELENIYWRCFLYEWYVKPTQGE